jgi:hypothetical protein
MYLVILSTTNTESEVQRAKFESSKQGKERRMTHWGKETERRREGREGEGKKR